MTNYPRVTHILKEAGIIDFSKVPQELMERALKFGTAAHKATELWDRKDLDIKTLSAPLIPYLDGWRRFCKDYGFQIIAIEEKVISEKYRYQGTLDRRGIIHDRMAIVDIKTSAAFHAGTRLQVAAYLQAYNETAIQKALDRYTVLLNEKGTYKLMKYTDKNDINVFLSALSLVNWKERNL